MSTLPSICWVASSEISLTAKKFLFKDVPLIETVCPGNSEQDMESANSNLVVFPSSSCKEIVDGFNLSSFSPISLPLQTLSV